MYIWKIKATEGVSETMTTISNYIRDCLYDGKELKLELLLRTNYIGIDQNLIPKFPMEHKETIESVYNKMRLKQMALKRSLGDICKEISFPNMIDYVIGHLEGLEYIDLCAKDNDTLKESILEFLQEQYN